MYSNSGQKPE
jgi:hypothetical protein